MIYPWLETHWKNLLDQTARQHHALLLAGPPGIGKGALALALARARLCEQVLPGGDSCGRCKACGWFDAGNHPDFRFVGLANEEDDSAEGDGTASAARSKSGARRVRSAREIRVDQIRALDGFLDVGAHRAGQRVIVIDPADAMNTVAANALLKRLEEPPPDAGFILVASRLAALPATIRSRCRRVPLGLPPANLAGDWLAAQSGLAPAQAALWLAAAGGAPLRALELAAEGDAGLHRRIVDAFAGMPESGVTATADALNAVDPIDWAAIAQTWAADLARVRAGAAPCRHPDRLDRLRRLASLVPLERLTNLERRLRALAREAPHSLNARLLLEDVLLGYQQALAPDSSTSRRMPAR
jgi:DNA polymerase-3 subunit delta'